MSERLRGIRARAALLAIAVVAVLLAGGGVVLSIVVERSLFDNLAATLQQHADDRLRLINEGADPSSMLTFEDHESFVRIEHAGVVTETGIEGDVACVAYPCTPSVLIVEEDNKVEAYDVLVVRAASGSTVVLIGSEFESVTESVGAMQRALVGGIIVMVLLTGLVIWMTVGRVLAPVEAIRATADATHGEALARRVPTTGTGDEIDRLAETVNEMLDRIEADADARKQFTSDASHELKSPLANLRAMIDTASPDSWDELAPSAEAEVDRMAGLVDDLLFLTVSDERHQLDHAAVHLDDVVFDEIEVMAAGNGIRIDGSSITPVMVDGDRRQLRRAVRNLLANAVRHAESIVRVRTSSNDDRGFLLVDDDGPGVPAAERERVFERFVRLDDARSRATGSTGLGLSIVAAVAERHGGEALVGDSDLGGASFELRLPLASR